METKNNSKKKFILIGLGTAAVGILGYFGWQYYLDHKANSNSSSDGETPNFDAYTPSPNAQLPAHSSSAATPSLVKSGDDFPLKKGSRGQRVKAVQEALMSKYGKSILPKYGADGDFGSETVAALKKSGLSEQVNESMYNILVKGSSADPKTTAMAIYKGIINRDFNSVMASLKSMKSVEDYSAVSDIFKTYRIGAVRKTLVNGVLDSFSNDSQKNQIRLEFSRMGLRYDGNQWSLSGVSGFTLITNAKASIWASASSSVSVPENTILGTEVERRADGFSVFENGGRLFMVKSNLVSYL